MFKQVKFAAPTALYRISQILTKIFRLQKKFAIIQNDDFTISKQSIETTIKFLYNLQLEDEIYILAFYYVDKITSIKEMYITKKNSTALLTACILLASKILNDDPISNRVLSFTSGLSVGELNTTELLLLDILNYKVNINSEDYNSYCQGFWKIN